MEHPNETEEAMTAYNKSINIIHNISTTTSNQDFYTTLMTTIQNNTAELSKHTSKHTSKHKGTKKTKRQAETLNNGDIMGYKKFKEKWKNVQLNRLNTKVGFMFASKPIVQLMTNPFICPLTNRYC